MSTPGKIFATLNLALSAAFLGWAANNLAAAEDFKSKYDSEVETSKAMAEEKDAELAKLRTDFQQLEQRGNTLREARDTLQSERDRLQADLDAANARINNLDGDITQIKASLDSYDQTNRTTVAALQQAQADLTAAVTARQDAEQQREAALAAQRDAEEAVASQQNLVAQLERDRADLKDEAQKLQADISSLVEYTGVSLGDVTSQKLIDGAVVSVTSDPAPGMIAINKGKVDGVERGYTFEIYGGGNYKGQVRVENVQDNMCSAIVLRTVSGQSINRGDSASTQI